MDKRAFLKSFSGTSTKTETLSLSTLQAYEGPWDQVHAKHLLSRAVFGPTKSQIDLSVDLGLGLNRLSILILMTIRMSQIMKLGFIHLMTIHKQ